MNLPVDNMDDTIRNEDIGDGNLCGVDPDGSIFHSHGELHSVDGIGRRIPQICTVVYGSVNNVVANYAGQVIRAEVADNATDGFEGVVVRREDSDIIVANDSIG